MADHVRAQLRDAVAAALTGLSTSGDNVFASRVYPLRDSELPGLRVYTTTEELGEPGTIHPPTILDRRIEVLVEAVARKSAGMDDELDQMAKEIEVALGTGVTVGATPVDLAYTGCTIELIGQDTPKPLGVARLTFEAAINTAAGTPDVLL